MYCIECQAKSTPGLQCSICGASQSEPGRDRRALSVGHVVAEKYRVGRVLGAGGFGITYLALDLQLQRRLALKEYVPNGLVSRAQDGRSIVCHSVADEAPFGRGLERFLKEGQVLARFDHPNIVRIYDVVQDNGTAYLAMEYLEGRTLQAILGEDGTLKEEDALDVMGFVFDALRTTHQSGVIHRDIKPDNIYVTTQGRTLLLDFGGAKQLTVESDRSVDAMVSHGYTAPEQYVGELEDIGPWTDVYATGATIYKLMTGRTLKPSLVRRPQDPPIDWLTAQPTERLKLAVDKALTLPHQERFATIAEFQAAVPFDAALPEASIETALPPLPAPKPPPKRRVWYLVGGLILAVALGALAWLKHADETEQSLRSQVKTAIALEGLRDRLSAYHQANGRFPTDFAELGVGPWSPDAEIRKLELIAGEINVELAIKGLEGRRLQLRPKGIVNGRVEFECWVLDVPEKYVPKDVCRMH